MKGLLLKDFYVAAGTCWPYLLVLIFFSAIVALGGASPFIILIGAYFMSMASMNVLATDERAKWHIFADTLPVTRVQVVAAKYILTLILAAFSAAVLALAGFIRTVNPALAGEGYTFAEALSALSVLPLTASFASLCMPFIFRLGFEKGRIAFLVLCVMAGMGCGILAALSGKDLPAIIIPSNITLIILAVSAAVFAASWAASTLLYKTREF